MRYVHNSVVLNVIRDFVGILRGIVFISIIICCKFVYCYYLLFLFIVIYFIVVYFIVVLFIKSYSFSYIF